MTEPLSIVIITRNAAHQIESCLKSAAFADEIVVMDSGSSDGTIEIAERHGARVLRQSWLGFGKQKQAVVNAARNNWVLCLDADERVSDELRASIEKELARPRFHVYRMPRCNRFMGRWLRHGEGYPDLSTRLFDRRFARWSDDAVHEKVLTQETIGSLAGDLLHESEMGVADYLEKQNRYTTLQADAMVARGRPIAATRMVLSPPMRFIKFYVLRLGFLDGVPGLVHIAIGCFNSFVKYAKVLERRRSRS